MTEPVALCPPLRRRRRWLLLLIVPLALGGGYGLYLHSANERLARVLAETDRLDPHWRLDDIEADRAVIPDEENSALTVLAAQAKMPPNSPRLLGLQQTIFVLQKSGPPTEKQIAAVRADLAPAADAITVARRLADLPRGRRPDSAAAAFPALEMAKLLDIDAQLRAWAGDYDGALISLRAAVNVGRSFGDEPSLMPQLVRLAADMVAVDQLQTILGQGEPTDRTLAPLQDLLAEEGEAPLFTFALRGERAQWDRLLESVQHGKMSVKQMTAAGAPFSNLSLNRKSPLYVPGVIALARANLLRLMNRLVEITSLPPEQQAAAFAELKASAPDEPLLLHISSPWMMLTYMKQGWEDQARCRCAVVGLAAERYRRKHGHWPQNLADLKGEFLREVPLDPFDGQALRYHRNDEGVVVYSVGPDGQSDPAKRQPNLCFRLWDVDKRRQAPPKPQQAPGAVP